MRPQFRFHQCEREHHSSRTQPEDLEQVRGGSRRESCHAVGRGTMKKLSLGGAMLAVVMAAPAVAADLPIEAPAYVERPPAIGLWNWTGFYIGGNAGYVRSSGSVDISAFSVPNTGGALLLSLYETMGGFGRGVQGGADWQTGNAGFGVEADFQRTSQS